MCKMYLLFHLFRIRGQDLEWENRNCIDDTRRKLCQRKCTTDVPTLSPTLSPTMSPSIYPTQNPTKSPTESPTQSPTRKPTDAPTTSIPTLSPTLNPTQGPTLSPITPAESVFAMEIIAGGVSTFCFLFALVAAIFVFRDRLPFIGNGNELIHSKQEQIDSKQTLKSYLERDMEILTPPPVVFGTPLLARSTRKSKKRSTSLVVQNPAFVDPPVISSKPKKIEVDEDIALLDSLIAAGTSSSSNPGNEVDPDIATLDALIAAGSGKNKKVKATGAPDNSYLKRTQAKPIEHRSIFAPSPDFIKKNTKSKADDEDLDI